MSKHLDVSYEGRRAYTIYLERDFEALPEALKTLEIAERRVLIVSDEHVAPLYLAALTEVLAPCCAGCEALVLPAGEPHKQLDTICRIYDRLLALGFGRKDLLLALGGGVIGDMVGYAAATYMRGIRFIQVPTTLLAQVDSSIGGKTGIDYRAYKNMIGAFHMPWLVYTNLSTLLSLDELQYASGMGEVIKHALLRSAAYFDYLCGHEAELKLRALDCLEETVYQSNLIKREIVELDPRELGLRACLNLGHTLGHAIEKQLDFVHTHGQCVAWGTLAAMTISDGICAEELARTRRLMAACGLALSLPETARGEAFIRSVLDAARMDKKMDGKQLKFILLRRLGEAYIDTGVDEGKLRLGLAAIY